MRDFWAHHEHINSHTLPVSVLKTSLRLQVDISKRFACWLWLFADFSLFQKNLKSSGFCFFFLLNRFVSAVHRGVRVWANFLMVGPPVEKSSFTFHTVSETVMHCLVFQFKSSEVLEWFDIMLKYLYVRKMQFNQVQQSWKPNVKKVCGLNAIL